MRVLAIASASLICCALMVSFGATPKKKPKPPVRKAPVSKKLVPAKKKISARRTAPRRRLVSYRPAASPVVRAAASNSVTQWLSEPGLLVNPPAMIPFFEQLYRLESGVSSEVLRVFHYGDSHTAADEWPGTLRYLLQTRFGDGGNGFSHAGRPWNGYRRLDLKNWGSPGWYSDGLGGREGDGLYGLSGVSVSAQRPGETVELQTDLEVAELHYLQQPDGGRIEISDNGRPIAIVSTDGEAAPIRYELKLAPGSHLLSARTLDAKPVRLHGWVTEKLRGITWETMGMNGAQASVVHKWEDAGLAPVFESRPPALIVLAYGTNEARNREWTYESYRDMFTALLDKFRGLAPAASILVVGPPDHQIRSRTGWTPHARIDLIVEAQRAACQARGVSFWDVRERMGGKGAMRQWVTAGMAQRDYVHFTAPGYRLLGAALYKELMGHFSTFARIRRETMPPVSTGAAAMDLGSPFPSAPPAAGVHGQALADYSHRP